MCGAALPADDAVQPCVGGVVEISRLAYWDSLPLPFHIFLLFYPLLRLFDIVDNFFDFLTNFLNCLTNFLILLTTFSTCWPTFGFFPTFPQKDIKQYQKLQKMPTHTKHILKNDFFSKVKKPKMSSFPTRVPPQPGRGTLWYHRVPYGTIRYLMVP